MTHIKSLTIGGTKTQQSAANRDPRAYPPLQYLTNDSYTIRMNPIKVLIVTMLV